MRQQKYLPRGKQYLYARKTKFSHLTKKITIDTYKTCNEIKRHVMKQNRVNESIDLLIVVFAVCARGFVFYENSYTVMTRRENHSRIT